MVPSQWKRVWGFLKELYIEFPFNLNNSTPGYTPKKIKNTCPYKYLHMNNVAMSIPTVKREKQPKCPLTNEGMKKMWPIHTMGYYTGVKKNEVQIHAYNMGEPGKC